MTTAGVELSVVMPMRNEAEHVGEQLAALAAQTWDRPWELVVVDNGSTDGSAELVEAWCDRFPGLTVLRAPEARSISAVRNVGAAAAAGDKLAFVDADDVVDPGWLGAMADALDHCDVAGGLVDLSRLNDAAALTWTIDGRDGLPVAYGFLPFASGSNVGARRRAFDALGGFAAEIAHAEDVDLSWRAQEAGLTLAPAPAALVHRRLRGTTGDLLRQHLRYGSSGAALYLRHRAHGMRRASMSDVLKELAFLIVRAYRLRDPAFRRFWVVVAARRLGHLVGSIRHRVLFL